MKTINITKTIIRFLKFIWIHLVHIASLNPLSLFLVDDESLDDIDDGTSDSEFMPG